MNHNSEELYLAFLRRKQKIKNLIDHGCFLVEERSNICHFTKQVFLTDISWHVSYNFDEKINPNIIHSWVIRNFTDYINDSFDNLTEDCNY